MAKTLVIDNYDSFTFNLVHLLAVVNQHEPIVVKNDECTWEEIRRMHFDNIVVSPGPGHPDKSSDFGVSRDVIMNAQTPLLGVCLGHQGIGSLAGGRVVCAPAPIHGKTSTVVHNGTGLFRGIPQLFAVARYHSLTVERPLPSDLIGTAWTDDGVLMGLEHRYKPQWGVQFHPESIITEWGSLLIENFREMTHEISSKNRRIYSLPATDKAVVPVVPLSSRRAFWKELPFAVTSEEAFLRLFGNKETAYWLDGGLVDPNRSRWSYMGDTEGPHGGLVKYRCADQELEIVDCHGREVMTKDIFDFLDESDKSLPMTPPPCPFVGGYVGWFGYELRPNGLPPSQRQARTPDALFIRADRFIAFDHLENRAYVVAIDDMHEQIRAERWIAAALQCVSKPVALKISPSTLPSAFVMDRSEEAYRADVKRCLDWIGQGETYQVCLTNEISCEMHGDPMDLYRVLRQINPAPYAAFVKWPGGAVLSASPERFMTVDRFGNVETKPIKGTARRVSDETADRQVAEQLRISAKDRAENVMIVDLLRNDLSKVCLPGSVTVPKLFEIESFSTVHQLVSTVRGCLKNGASSIDLVRATFPGGSMTGAPKVRTLELIDQLEMRARGVYSGALGWLGQDGAVDLSVVIRTIVATEGRLSFGVGGGVVADSTPEGEFNEMLLKAQASKNAINMASAQPHAVTVSSSASPKRPLVELTEAFKCEKFVPTEQNGI